MNTPTAESSEAPLKEALKFLQTKKPLINDLLKWNQNMIVHLQTLIDQKVPHDCCTSELEANVIMTYEFIKKNFQLAKILHLSGCDQSKKMIDPKDPIFLDLVRLLQTASVMKALAMNYSSQTGGYDRATELYFLDPPLFHLLEDSEATDNISPTFQTADEIFVSPDL